MADVKAAPLNREHLVRLEDSEMEKRKELNFLLNEALKEREPVARKKRMGRFGEEGSRKEKNFGC